MILLLLVLAAPERVVIQAREPEHPGIFAKLDKALTAAAHRLYEKEDPDVALGNSLAAQNEPESALREYEKARERHPDSAALAFNRAGALLKLDPSKAPEAASEASKALQSGDAHLKPQAAYHLALATEAMGKPDDAIKGYGLALGLDPEDRDAKVNLELLLRTEEERKQKQQAGQPQDKKQQGKDEQKQQQGKDEKKEQKKQEGEQKQEEKQTAKEEKQEKKKEQAAEEKPVDRSEAERLLDALKAGEKNLQVWRFAKDKRKEARRSEPERDW
jgi:Ca-activated chloride channel family protein